MYTSPTDPIVEAKTACPFCSSLDVKTTSKAVNESTYWRCTACGQIWNAGRLQQRGANAYDTHYSQRTRR